MTREQYKKTLKDECVGCKYAEQDRAKEPCWDCARRLCLTDNYQPEGG
jgi:hypothetical protein